MHETDKKLRRFLCDLHGLCQPVAHKIIEMLSERFVLLPINAKTLEWIVEMIDLLIAMKPELAAFAQTVRDAANREAAVKKEDRRKLALRDK